MKNNKSYLAILLAVISLATGACGSDATTSTSTGGTTDTATLTDSQQELTTEAIEQTVDSVASGLTSLSASVSAPFVVVDCGAICTTSGSCSITTETDSFAIDYALCENASGTFDGSFSVMQNSSTSFTLTADEFRIETVDETFSLDGSVSVSLSGSIASASFDSYAGTFTSGSEEFTATFDGDIDVDIDNETVDGTLTITFSGDVDGTVTCDFDQTDMNDSTAMQNACF